MNKFELCGWIGAILVLVAYYMVSTGKAKADSKPFQAINISGAIFLVAYTYNCQAYASMIVNIIWVGIGMTSILKIIDLPSFKLRRKVLMKTKTKLITVVFSLLILLTSTNSYSEELTYNNPEQASISEETTISTNDESLESGELDPDESDGEEVSYAEDESE